MSIELRSRDRMRSENFPVALRVLPRHRRDALCAVYGYARWVDELGDSASGDRVALLAEIDAEVSRAWAAERVAHPVVAHLREVGVTDVVPEQPFHDLVLANLQDQRVDRYESYVELRGYCRLSAEPVGRIVLALFGQTAPELVELSDRVCAALQLLEHWQDVGEDRAAGRVYLPADDMRRYAVSPTDLDLPRATAELAALMRFEIERAAELLASGAPLVGLLHGWARVCVAGYVAGGQATVAALRRTGGDVLGRPAGPSRAGTAVRLLTLLAVRS